MTPQEERLRELAKLYIETVTALFETIQCSGFTLKEVRDEVARLDAEMGETMKL